MASRCKAAKIGLGCSVIGLLCLVLLQSPQMSSAQSLSLRVCELQGAGSSSPYSGAQVQTEGVVHLDLDETSRKGFFLQNENCDQDPLTSDGIFVYLGEQGNWVASGDRVQVDGRVQEYYGLTEIASSPADVSVLSHNNPLPEAVQFDPPAERAAGSAYLETLEGMRLGLDKAHVVGPTDTNDRTWVVGADTDVERLFLDEVDGLGLCVDDGGNAEISPEARVGETIQGLSGALDFNYGLFCLQLDTAPLLTPLPESPIQPPTGGLRIATFNLHNLFDTQDDPLTEDTVLSAFEYERRLNKRALAIVDALGAPAVLAVQEVENDTVLGDLAARPELAGVYEFVWFDSPDRRGIDNAVLYRPEQVSPLSAEARQECTILVDGLGPDGNGDPLAPENSLTCDTDGDGVLDGNRLFSRSPLIVRLQILGSQEPGEVWVIANHWKSKSEDTSTIAYTLPRRIVQARFVAELVAEIQALDADASILILGDLNDTQASAPLAELSAAGMVNLWERLPPSERYSYIYQGYSQAIDHILVSGPWLTRPGDGLLWAARINADYPARYTTLSNTLLGSSDHDPLLARFSFFTNQAFMPLIRTSVPDAALRESSP